MAASCLVPDLCEAGDGSQNAPAHKQTSRERNKGRQEDRCPLGKHLLNWQTCRKWLRFLLFLVQRGPELLPRAKIQRWFLGSLQWTGHRGRGNNYCLSLRCRLLSTVIYVFPNVAVFLQGKQALPIYGKIIAATFSPPFLLPSLPLSFLLFLSLSGHVSLSPSSIYLGLLWQRIAR